jgi:hypothetical protein
LGLCRWVILFPGAGADNGCGKGVGVQQHLHRAG